MSSTDPRSMIHLPIQGSAGREVVLGHCRRGLFLYDRADIIGQFLERYGEWAETELTLLLPLIEPGDTVLDIGANIGTHSIPFAQAVGPLGTVYAFEPQERSFAMFAGNTALNGIDNVRLLRMAVGAESGILKVPRAENLPHGLASAVGVTGNPRARDARVAVGDEVECITLDSAFPHLKSIKLIKIDVEGGEPGVIRGALGLITICRPYVYAEVKDAKVAAGLIHQLAPLGYSMLWHACPGFNPNNFRGTSDNPYGTLGDANVLCVPPGAAVPNDLRPFERFEDVYELFPGVLNRPANPLRRWLGR